MPAVLKIPRLRVRRGVRRFGQDRRGSSAVEFTVMAPVLMAFFLGSMEISNLIWTRSSVGDAATAAADLTTRYVGVDDTTMLSIMQASERMINPEARAVSGFAMTVSSVLACESPANSGTYRFKVIWSHGYTNGGLQTGRARNSYIADMPQAMGPPSGGTLIFAEATYTYELPYGFVLSQHVQTMSSVAYFRPRLSRAVAHTGSFAGNAAATCP